MQSPSSRLPEGDSPCGTATGPFPSALEDPVRFSLQECAMRHGAFTAGLLAAGLLLAGCGSSPTSGGGSARATSDPYAPYAALTGAQRTQKLLADAKSEGGVLDLYTSNTDIQDLVDG